MKAVRYHRYGSPDVLSVEDVDPPVVGEQDVLIRVRAASVNPLDFHFMRGTPYVVRIPAGLSKPKVNGLGADLAGHVEAVGGKVTAFQAGDEVYGARIGWAFAEYAAIRQDRAVLRKPANLTFEQAAAVPIAAFTALQAVRDKGRVQPGQKVLVNGASGGVGTFAVQIARAYGAEVTGVCSTGNVELVRSIGAHHVVDYTRDDLTRIGRHYDVIVDMAGNHSLSEIRRLLTPKGVLVAVGGPVKGQWIGPFTDTLKLVALSLVVRQRLAPMLAKETRADLIVLNELIEAGQVVPVIDRTYPLGEVAQAIGYLEQGHARGKVVITM